MSQDFDQADRNRDEHDPVAQAGARRKPWRAPQVLTSRFELTETGPHTAADARNGSQRATSG
jgi:hypothetical protein